MRNCGFESHRGYVNLGDMIDVDLTETDTGWRVKETETHYIEITPMLVNWRLHTIRKDHGPLG